MIVNILALKQLEEMLTKAKFTQPQVCDRNIQVSKNRLKQALAWPNSKTNRYKEKKQLTILLLR